ncbi:RING finger protein-like protein [Leptotrombidium deliense]|uniref:RBR-type E3 ubiquitin transferase n=1 Tax=Leptotrombidium deliense TaxID=299467 RepID=A0A443S9E0_9ACAR|nr:RING finger protein-like protein [Leptotrombidium deliense]
MECPICYDTFENNTYLKYELKNGFNSKFLCMICSTVLHPDDVKQSLNDEKLFKIYEKFTIRRSLNDDRETRWCPSTDCEWAVVGDITCNSCPEIECQKCFKLYCYNCKNQWFANHDCVEKKFVTLISRVAKQCPSCDTPIAKIEDGSCNHIQCSYYFFDAIADASLKQWISLILSIIILSVKE